MKTLETFFGWFFIALGGLSVLMSFLPSGRTSQEVLGIVLIIFGYVVLKMRRNE
jgi:uncharacterized membrane protein